MPWEIFLVENCGQNCPKLGNMGGKIGKSEGNLALPRAQKIYHAVNMR